MPKSYKVEVQAPGPDWASNSLRFPTEGEADAYGHDLWMRWTMVRDMRVVESDDEVSDRFVNGKGSAA